MPPSLSGKIRQRYEADSDSTLTEHQAKQAGFHPQAWQSDEKFRYDSNPLKGKSYNSGYHESAVTTDTFVFLRAAKDLGNGTAILPATAPKNSYFEDHTGKLVSSTVLTWVLKNADGFRTDTAQTILSAPGGKSAGHSGSDLCLAEQGPAHDLLRDVIMRVLPLDPAKAKGLTERSLVVLFGSITVTSIAPGELARTLPGGTASLKAGTDAKTRWESNRNEAKRRVDELLSGLSTDEHAFVLSQAGSFMDSTQEGVVSNRRSLAPKKATSEERDESVPTLDEVGGVGYLNGTTATLAQKAPPLQLAQQGLGMTESFRGGRR